MDAILDTTTETELHIA